MYIYIVGVISNSGPQKDADKSFRMFGIIVKPDLIKPRFANRGGEKKYASNLDSYLGGIFFSCGKPNYKPSPSHHHGLVVVYGIGFPT